MGQVTIYIPKDLEQVLRENARNAGKSLSAYLRELANRACRPKAWPEGFNDLFGSWEGTCPHIADPPPETIDPL